MISRLVIACALLAGCQRSKEEAATAQQPPVQAPRAAAGTERGDCRPDHTCDSGFLCLSDLCVRPPAADCQAVAETLSAFELGNYAPPAKRNETVAAKRAACEAQHLTKDDQRCIDGAKDKWATAKCVPAMYPELAPGKGGDCETVVAKMQQLIGTQMGANGAGAAPEVQRMLALATNAVRASCLEDGWPSALKACFTQLDASAPNGMKQCESLMPPGLEDKMQKRMAALMGTP